MGMGTFLGGGHLPDTFGQETRPIFFANTQQQDRNAGAKRPITTLTVATCYIFYRLFIQLYRTFEEFLSLRKNRDFNVFVR